MTTKTPSKPGKPNKGAKAPENPGAQAPETQPADQDEVLKLQAELEAAKAELAQLKGGNQAKTVLSPKAQKRAEWRKPVAAEAMEPEDSLLGKAQRMERDHLLTSTFKAVRALKWDQLPELFSYLASRCAQDGGETGEDTVEKLVGEFTSKRAPKAKAE